MLAETLTASQKQALGRLLSTVEMHERELRGALPGSRSKMSHVGEPLQAPYAISWKRLLNANDRACSEARAN